MKHIKIFSLTSEYETSKSGGTLITPNVSLINEDNSVRYLPELNDPYNGHEYVDLGLPSGLKWAKCNVGASSPEEYGLYFAWGETTGYTANDVTSGVRAFTQDEYNAGPAASISADLTLEQDAAHVNLGGNWRMPTKDEFQELVDNCNVVWINDYNGTGINGLTFTSNINMNSIFVPAAGSPKDSLMGINAICFYYTMSWYSSSNSYSFMRTNGSPILINGTYRYISATIRAVCE